ncbi:hydrogen peroxide-inducible activator, partial [Vibrio parahaemolyticus V-223/04]
YHVVMNGHSSTRLICWSSMGRPCWL